MCLLDSASLIFIGAFDKSWQNVGHRGNLQLSSVGSAAFEPCTGGLNPSHHFCAENLENLSRTQWAPLTDSGLTLLGLEREAPHVRLTSIDMTLHFSASMFQQGERTIFTSYFRLIVSCPDMHLQMLSGILQAQNSIGLQVHSPQLQTELGKRHQQSSG